MSHLPSAPMPPQANDTAAWIAVLAGVSAALHVGKLAPALPALRAALDIDLLQAGFLLSMVQLAGMSLGLLIGLSADGWGLRRSMLTGLVLQIVAGTVGAFARDTWSLLALRALEGLGFLLVVMPAPAIIRQVVSNTRLSRMLGVWGAYMPGGTAVALLVGPWWIGLGGTWGGWQGWWLLLSAISLMTAVLVWRGIAPDCLRSPGNDATANLPAPASWLARLRLTLGSKGPWLVALCFAVYAGQWQAVIGFLPSIYAQSGVDAAWIGVMSALIAAVNMIGNIMSGRMLQRGWRPIQLLRIGYLAMALGAFLCFAQWGGAWQASAALRYLAVLGFSAVGGLIPGTLFMLSVRLAPSDTTVSTTVGFMQQLSALGQFAGPPLVAMVAQAAGGWQWTWIVTGSCSAIGLGITIWVQRQLDASPRLTEVV